jgi:UDP-N-acetylglucosamine 3-dehydrogenase
VCARCVASATDYRRLLDDTSINVVSITTHWREHAAIACEALAAGKHVLLEKPLAANPEECSAVLTAARQSTGWLMVGHVCRFDPRVTLAQRAIAEGRLGRIVSMHARRNLPRAPGSLRLDKISPFMGDGIHDADLMMWFSAARPRRVFARYVRVDEFAYPDLGWAVLEFGESAIGVIETVWRLPPNTPTAIDAQLEIIGTEGSLAIDCGHAGLSILDARGLQWPDTAYWPLQHGQRVGALAHELAYFADCIRQHRRPSVITPEEAANAVLVMATAEASAAAGQPMSIARYF